MSKDLTAKPTVENGQVVKWELCHSRPTQKNCGTGEPGAEYPAVYLKKGSGDHNIKITIINGDGITFAPSNPLWIQANTKPQGPIVSPTDQINPAKIVIKDNGKTLEFNDANSNWGNLLLKYQLNFVGPGNATSAIDPDVTNGGKTLSGLSSAAELAVLGAVALALAAVAFKPANGTEANPEAGINNPG